jgi:hypothetical protein
MTLAIFRWGGFSSKRLFIDFIKCSHLPIQWTSHLYVSSMKSCFDEKLLRWKAILMKSCFNEKPFWWKAASMKSHFDEKLLWWKAASMKSCFDEKLIQWKAVLMNWCFNEKPFWWIAASMKSCLTHFYSFKSIGCEQAKVMSADPHFCSPSRAFQEYDRCATKQVRTWSEQGTLPEGETWVQMTSEPTSLDRKLLCFRLAAFENANIICFFTKQALLMRSAWTWFTTLFSS